MNEEEKVEIIKDEVPSNEEIQTEEVQNEEPCEELSSDDEIAQLKSEITALKDENLREHADFENIKKRLEKEKYQAINYAHEQFARDLLPIIDALENAIASASTEEVQSEEVINKYKEGIELTIEQFRKCFDKHGIKPVEAEGEFDPNVHEAVMKVDNEEVESGHIVQSLQKGYTIKDRVLRPAMVSIAK